MSQFNKGTRARTAERKARHKERLETRWRGHVPPIEVWRAGDSNALESSPGQREYHSLGAFPGEPDPPEFDNTSSNS